MAKTDLRSGESNVGTTKPGEEASITVANLHGQNWLLVPANVEPGSNASVVANKGLQFSTIIGLLVSVFAIVGTVVLLVNPRFEDVNHNINRLESEIADIQGRMTNFETRLVELDGKLDAIGNMIIVAFQDGELDSEEIRSIWQQASQ